MPEMGPTPVVMLANGHVAFDTRIFHKEALTLARHGFRVSIIVPHERDEVKDSVSIVAVPVNKKGWRKLLINPFNILRKALGQPANAVFHIHDSDILMVGLVLKLLGRKVVYDAHEDTPLQIRYQHWLPGIAKVPYRWFYFLLEKICGWCFDAIIVAEPVIARYFPPRKTFLLRNFPLMATFETATGPPYSARDNTMIHVGVLSRVRGLYEMSEAFSIAKKQMDIRFVLGGQFAPASLEKELTGRYPVDFIGWVSYPRLIALLFTARLGIIIPHPIPRYKTNYPVKLFEFMAAGLPVIASREGESAVFVREANCGILVNPLDTNEVAEAILRIFRNPSEAKAMGDRGRDLIRTRYNWEKESEVLLGVYSRLGGA